MASPFDHGSIRTAAMERVVAPIASHLCHLVLMCDGAEEPEQFGRLEGAARAVAKATENMAAVASRQASGTEDEVLRAEMSSLVESLTASGQHVLLAAQKLSIQPGVTEHREELVAATQNVFLGVVKVLLVDDDAAVRGVVAAADRVLDCLSELGSAPDVASLLGSFRAFSRSLLRLNGLTAERADALLDPRQSERLLGSLGTLRRCVSMLHTATCATLRHPASEQAQAAKRYVLDTVRSTVGDIVGTLRSERLPESPGPCGYYTGRRDSLLQLLASSSSSVRGSRLDSLVRDLVFHCMVVADASRRDSQQRVVGHCRHVLQLWSDIKGTLKSSADPDGAERSLERPRALLARQIRTLDEALVTALLHQVLDTFPTASSTVEELLGAAGRILEAPSPPETDVDSIQPTVEDFISSTDRIIRLAGLIAAVAADAKSLEGVENSRASLARLRARAASASLELADNSTQTVRRLHDACREWIEETGQLQDALGDVMDAREFTSVALREMVHERHGCDEAYRGQSHRLFDEHATRLLCHMTLVIRSARRHVDRSDDPIYRNGLLVLLKQVQSFRAAAAESIRVVLSDAGLDADGYTAFSSDASAAIERVKVLRRGLDGQQHPHLLSPLREGARGPDLSPPRSPLPDACDRHVGGRARRRSGSPALGVAGRDSQTEREEERSDEETLEAEPPRKYDGGDLNIPAVCGEPRRTNEPPGVDLLPLLHEVVTVTRGGDVTALNRACTGVLELSNSYAQAAKEALAVVDAADRRTLEGFRAELVSLTPLLVQTAQETAIGSAMGTERIHKYSAQFSDLIVDARGVLLPAAGAWYHAVRDELLGNAAAVGRQLNEVMALCADTVQLLTSSDWTPPGDGQETLGVLHGKLNRAQNHARHLAERSATPEGRADELEGLCLLWGLSVRILLDSVDGVLGRSAASSRAGPQKQLSALSENSLRIQEAARLTGLSCKSAHKSKQLTAYRDELKTLTEACLLAAEELDAKPSLTRLATSEFLQRRLIVQIRALAGHLSKANKGYDGALRNLVSVAYAAAAGHPRGDDTDDAGREFETAAHSLFENVKRAAKAVEDSLSYVRDPRARSNLRSINDHLSFQISDIVGRARLAAETRRVGDALGLDVQLQCWSAKARYVVEEIGRHDGVRREAEEHIRAGLQGRAAAAVGDIWSASPSKAKGVDFPSGATSWQEGRADWADVAEPGVTTTCPAAESTRKNDAVESGAHKDASSLTRTSLFLKRESDSWDPRDNGIVQVTRRMADTICYMTQYLRRRGPIPNKEAFVASAKDVISSCQSATQFIRAIANHCVDKQSTVELSLVVEQILTVTNQLHIISSVNAVTPGCKSSDEILVKNAQNLLETVLRGVRAAETACMTGLTQPEPDSDGAEATALCFQWRRRLEIHRARQTSNPETDELGLRRTSSHPVAPSLVTATPSQHK